MQFKGTAARVSGGDISPATLPVERPTSFELVINELAAEDMSIGVPPVLLAYADEGIE